MGHQDNAILRATTASVGSNADAGKLRTQTMLSSHGRNAHLEKSLRISPPTLFAPN